MTASPQLPPTQPVGTATTAPPAAHGATPAERVEVVRLPDALLARLINSARPLILSGTVQQPKPDGTIPLRTQLGEILLNAGKTVVAKGQISLHIPPPAGANPAAQLNQRGLTAFILTPPSGGTVSAPTAMPAAPTAASPVPAAPGGLLPQASTAASPGQPALPPASPPTPATGTGQAGSNTSVSLTAQMLGQRTAPGGPTAGQLSPGATAPVARPGQPAPAAAPPGIQAAPTTGTGSPGAAPGSASSSGGMPALAASADRLAAPSPSTRPAVPLPPAHLLATSQALPAAEQSVPGTRMLRSLTETLQVLAQGNDALAGQVMRALVPQPGSRLTASLLLFFFAVRGGDSRGWLGERASATLDAAGRGDLLGRLTADFAAMGRGDAAPGLAGEARPVTIPFLFGGELHGLRFSILADPEQDDPAGRRKRRGKRFQIDLELSQLGPVQLEGMMNVKRFDLALRTYRALPREARAEAVKVFEAACQASGLVGSLTLQSGPRFWMDLATQGRLGPRANVSA